MKTLFLILALFITAFSSELRMSDYGKPNDNVDDSVAFQNAINDLAAAGGGTLIVDAGEWNLNNPISFVTYTKIGNSFIIKGQKGAFLLPKLRRDQTLFTSGNQNQIYFEDLIVVGSEAQKIDFDKFLFVSYVNQIRITGCQFFGLKAYSSLIHIGNADATIKDTLFHGISSSEAVIRATDFRGLSVSDSEFMDYGNLNGVYYSKTPDGNGPWIKATAGATDINAFGQRPLSLHNVRFDEGAPIAVHAQGVSYVQAEGVMTNLSSMDGSSAFSLNNVKYAEIKMSKFGYTSQQRPAIKAANNTTVFIDGITTAKGVFYGVRDGTSRAIFSARTCSGPECEFSVDMDMPSPATKAASGKQRQ